MMGLRSFGLIGWIKLVSPPKQALRIWEQYYEQRRLMEKEESSGITPFDAETYKKQLDAAKNEFENFSKIQSDSFKKCS